jgi:hypothetical protein
MTDQSASEGRDTLAEFPSPERRRFDRHYCGQELWIRFIARPEFQPVRAVLHNLSPRGIGMLARRSFPAETLLAIQFQGKYTGVSGIVTANVRHSVKLRENLWFLGCSLSRSLAQPELSTLIRPA